MGHLTCPIGTLIGPRQRVFSSAYIWCISPVANGELFGRNRHAIGANNEGVRKGLFLALNAPMARVAKPLIYTPYQVGTVTGTLGVVPSPSGLIACNVKVVTSLLGGCDTLVSVFWAAITEIRHTDSTSRSNRLRRLSVGVGKAHFCRCESLANRLLRVQLKVQKVPEPPRCYTLLEPCVPCAPRHNVRHARRVRRC